MKAKSIGLLSNVGLFKYFTYYKQICLKLNSICNQLFICISLLIINLKLDDSMVFF
jgi:hypothetical protein